MKNKKHKILKSALLTVPLATMSVASVGIYLKNNSNSRNNSLLLKNASLNQNANSISSYDTGMLNALNPDTIINYGNHNIFSDSDITLISNIFKNLKNNYSNIKKVRDFLDTYPTAKFLNEFKTSKFAKELRNLIKGINHIDEDQGQKRWFSIKTPHYSRTLTDNVVSNVNSFNPQIAEFDENNSDTYKISIDVGISPNISLPGGAQHISLYIHNGNQQFSKTNDINQLIKQHDIFIRDEDKNDLSSSFGTTNLFYIKKEGSKVKVFLKLKIDDQVNINVESLENSSPVKSGYLNSDSNFGVNPSNIPNQDIGVYASGTSVVNNTINFSMVRDSSTTASIPIYFKDNENKDKLKISFTNNGAINIEPKNIQVEDGIINPQHNPNFNKTNNPIKISKTFGQSGENVYLGINYGKDGSFNKKKLNKISFDNLNVKPESKIFFENIVKNPLPAKDQSIDFVSFKDPNKEAKRVLSEIFTQWLQVDDKYKKMLPGQSSKLSLGTHKISHENYKKIHISDKYTTHSNLTGVKMIKVIREEEAKINDILKNTGNANSVNKHILFSNASNTDDVFLNMNNWLYSYSDKTDEKINELSKFIKDNANALNNLDIQKKVRENAENILAYLVQKRENELVNNFQKIILGNFYKYFGKSLKLSANNKDQIISRNAFKTIDVKYANQTIKGIIEKDDVNLVNINDVRSTVNDNTKPTKNYYLQQVINRILGIIKKNKFDEFLFDNKKEFIDNMSKITNEKTYLDSNKGNSHITSDFSEAKNAFNVLNQLFKYYNISINDLLEYSTMDKNLFNEAKMLDLIKQKILSFQNAFLNEEREINFFGKKFHVKKTDSLLTSINTKTTLEKLDSVFKMKKMNVEHNKITKILRTNLSTDESIDKFAIALKKYNIKDYISYYSSNPDKHVEDIWNSDIKNMDYDLAKPLTPGNFGQFLNHSKEINGSLFAILGATISIISAMGIYMVKTNGEYSYNKMSVEEVFTSSETQSVKKNKLLKISLACLLVFGIVMLIIGVLILTNVIAPAIFMI